MDRSIIGNLRLFSGLILFIFVLGHFINHALGIISLRAMNDWLWLFIQPWREPVGEIILLLALIIHVFLALYSLYKRKSINMSWQDASQLVSGFLIPILLAGHGGGSIDSGRHIRVPQETPTCNLFMSMLDRFGTPVDFIGDSTGRLSGLQI